MTWRPEAQEEAIASLAKIEEQFVALQTLSPEDRDALARGAEDVKLGRFATDVQAKVVLIVADVYDVRLTATALAEIKDICSYIRKDNPIAARL